MTKQEITLVLLPGLHGTDALFEPLISTAPPYFNILTFNYPVDEFKSYQQLQAMVELEICKIATPFILLGESFAGPLALKLANEKPENLLGVVLVGTFVTAPNLKIGKFLPWTVLFALANIVFKPFIWLCRRPKTYNFVSVLIEVDKNNSSILADRLRSTYRVDARDDLKQCPVPLVYFCGDRDFVVLARSLALIQAIRPDVQVTRFNTSHAILQHRKRLGKR